MFSFKKKSRQENLRRRFHHSLISKRKDGELPTQLPRHLMKARRANFLVSARYTVIRKIMFLTLSVAAFLGIFYIVFFSSFFIVTKVNVDKKGEVVSASAIEPYLTRLRGKNILFLNAASFNAELEQAFSNEILLVSTKKSFPHQLTVKIDEYPISLVLRLITPSGTQNIAVNQAGFAVFENRDVKNVPILILRSDKPIRLKTQAVDRERLALIANAYKFFTDTFGIKIIEGEWKKPERELHLKTEKNFTVWLDLTADIEKQILKLKKALSRLDIYNQPLEYIDLRIAGGENEKIIFKRR